ncbi:hypothetical protein SDC9_191874 [bioreactor metagenome]|uniref:Uncharacterized protein n=1 Tax=bioreactor metagenome TaxID=1076179 RepID=A0A645I0P4_9ZZZZ
MIHDFLGKSGFALENRVIGLQRLQARQIFRAPNRILQDFACPFLRIRREFDRSSIGFREELALRHQLDQIPIVFIGECDRRCGKCLDIPIDQWHVAPTGNGRSVQRLLCERCFYSFSSIKFKFFCHSVRPPVRLVSTSALLATGRRRQECAMRLSPVQL